MRRTSRAGRYAERVLRGFDDGGADEQVVIWIERKEGGVWAVGRIVNPQHRRTDEPRRDDYVFEGYELDDALEHANATQFGLGGSVWSADPKRAAAVAGELETGTAWINTHAVLAPHQPFGGTKWSGIGVENGPWGLYGFTELQVLHHAR